MTILNALREWLAAWRNRPPLVMPGPFLHPRLGTLTYEEEGWWSGIHRTDAGDELVLIVTGDLTEPSETEASALATTLSRYTALRAEVFSFLRAKLVDPRIRHEDFSITGIDHLWEDGGGHFFVDLAHPEDPGAIWRVEYFDGSPCHVTCDR